MHTKRWLGWLAALWIGVALFAPLEGQQAPQVAPAKKGVEQYASDGELVASLPLTGGKPYRYWTVYSVKLPGLKKGDLVIATAQFEATNDLGYNAMFAHALLCSDKELILKGGNKPGDMTVCEYAGENITRDTHHGFRTLASSFVAEQNGDAWLSVVIYAASTAARIGDKLTVQQGYGGLRAVVLRN